MTFTAQENERTNKVDVNVTYGPITIKVEEDPGHLRSFARELDRLLTRIESKENHDG